MTDVEITIGYDRRTWAHVKVKAATAEEIAVLSETDSQEALDLARRLDAAGRLEELWDHSDDNPAWLADESRPAVVDIDTDPVGAHFGGDDG